MKRIIFIISLISVLTLSSFGQQPLNSDYLVRKYIYYMENPTPFQNKALSYSEWKNKFSYIEESRDLQTQYNSDGYLIKSKKIMSSGDYLIRAQKQKITGYVFEFVGVGIVCASPNKIGIIGIGTCSLIALVCEVSSVNNINKARSRVSLSQNGIGVKLRF